MKFSVNIAGGGFLLLLSFILLLYTVQNCTLSSLSSKISFNIENMEGDEYRVDMCYIDSFDDLYNGSEHLVISSKSSKKDMICFNYNPSEFRTGVFRFNIFHKENIDASVGSMIKKGSNSNFIFYFPELNNDAIVSLTIDSIQSYRLSDCNNLNIEYLDLFSELKGFNGAIDQVGLLLENCQSLHCRDSLKRESFNTLQKYYTTVVKRFLDRKFDHSKVKLFAYHYFLSEFFNEQIFDEILYNIKDEKDLIGIKAEITQRINKKNSYSIKLSSSQITILHKLDINVKHLKKPILIDIWASWCGPCRTENRTILRNVAKTYKDDIDLVSVSVDKDSLSWKRANIEDNITWLSIIIPRTVNTKNKQADKNGEQISSP